MKIKTAFDRLSNISENMPVQQAERNGDLAERVRTVIDHEELQCNNLL